ncbi:MAG: hypothetical protein QG657_2211, partial [Acidobacteriota bacterium]|nr:hypothetical protein [Acidobacteriota bacterium]
PFNDFFWDIKHYNTGKDAKMIMAIEPAIIPPPAEGHTFYAGIPERLPGKAAG